MHISHPAWGGSATKLTSHDVEAVGDQADRDGQEEPRLAMQFRENLHGLVGSHALRTMFITVVQDSLGLHGLSFTQYFYRNFWKMTCTALL